MREGASLMVDATRGGKPGLISRDAHFRIKFPSKNTVVATGCPLTAFWVTCGIAVPFPTWC